MPVQFQSDTWWFELLLSRHREFTGFQDKSSIRISKRGPGGYSPIFLRVASVSVKWHRMIRRKLTVSSSTNAWPRHQMETFSALLALCEGNPPVTRGSPHKDQWRGSLIFSLICTRTNGWANNRDAVEFETPSCPLWQCCNVYKSVIPGTYSMHCWCKHFKVGTSNIFNTLNLQMEFILKAKSVFSIEMPLKCREIRGKYMTRG